ncbi:MAG: fatty acyl-AMP ligase [Cyanobacteria bacterium P01_E01_bin.6]
MFTEDSLKGLHPLATLVDLLRYRAQLQPDKTAFIFLIDGETQEQRWTYRDLDRRAQEIAALLQSHCRLGDRALLLYPPGLDFIAAFFGCLYAGVVAVPAYPPSRDRQFAHLQSLLTATQATLLLSTQSLIGKLKQASNLASLRWLATDVMTAGVAQGWQEPRLTENALAFLQYTSGSTGSPKGVMVTHHNLLHNQRTIQQSFGHSSATVIVGWLPLFHDMGLIGNVLQPLYLGIPCILLSPIAFLQKPHRWLQAISRYRATTSGGPNFAYDACIRKTTSEQCADLDLSSWDVAFNGAEPVRAETLARFAQTFAPKGFKDSAFYPCYGMAEATLFVTGGLKTAPPTICSISAPDVEQNRAVAANGQVPSRSVVGCGRTWLAERVSIVNPKTLVQCPADQIGEVWIAGPSVARGYWQQPQATEQTFQAYLADTKEGPFLRTGDLGFMQEGELFITGRLKDTIVIRGRNYYPQDIERTVEQSHPALRSGCGAAFGVEIAGEEHLVVVQEVERSHRRSLDVNTVLGDIQEATTAEHGLHIHAIVLIETGSIPKTSSGKIQRHACRQAFLTNSLNCLANRSRAVQIAAVAP